MQNAKQEMQNGKWEETPNAGCDLRFAIPVFYSLLRDLCVSAVNRYFL
jgi:hypothetical protein